jgi:hypothetical protein
LSGISDPAIATSLKAQADKYEGENSASASWPRWGSFV